MVYVVLSKIHFDMAKSFGCCFVVLVLWSLAWQERPVFGRSNMNFEQEKVRINSLYESGRYRIAQRRIERLIPEVTDRDELLTLRCYRAYCHFHCGDYRMSSSLFHDIIEEYHYTADLEEVAFMCGYSLSFVDVDADVDQSDTHMAIGYLKDYLAHYPGGCYLEKAQSALKDLYLRLMNKRFAIAKLYYRSGHYRASIMELENIAKEFVDYLLYRPLLELFVKNYQALAKQAHLGEDEQAMLEKQNYYAGLLDGYHNSAEAE